MKSASTLILLLTMLFHIHVSAQNNFNKPDPVVTILKKILYSNKEERIIVQTNRKLYLPGEKIWFKAFVVNAVTNRVSLSCKNLFADLVDDNDNVIAKLILNNRELNTAGAFTLPDSLKTGFYWLRCYTAKMLAEDTGSIFVQPIYILNKGLQDAAYYNSRYTNNANKNINTSPVMHFFPERLTGIPDIISTGVLQITDAGNKPLTVAGEIINNKDSVITSFTTNHFGLARVTFLNDASLKYYALFHINGRDIKYSLPAIDHSKVQLSVLNQTDKTIKAFVTLEDSMSSNFHTVILGIHGDSLCYAALGTGNYGITIPLNNFPGGINSLLLFDEQQHLLAERKIYITRNNVELSIKANKKNYTARENAELNIKITDADKQPLQTTLNIAVEDAWLSQLSDSIETNNFPPSDEFLLNNWLALYHDKYSLGDIDLLMVTAKQMYKPSETDTTNALNDDNDQKLLNFIGKVTDKKDNGIKDRVITVMSKNQSGFFMDADTTKENGIFKIPLPQMDSLSFSLQVRDKHGAIRTEDNITIDTFNFPRATTPVLLKQQYLAYNINTIALLRKFHVDTAITFQGKGWLNAVTVTTVKKEEPNYDISRRLNSISQIVTNDKFRYSGYNAISNALLLVPGVSLLNGDITIFGGGTPLVLMDENPIDIRSTSVVGFLNELNAADIDFIEILRGGEAAMYGVRGGSGVISINTKHGPDKTDYSKINFKTFTPLTYHICPQFFMPDYSNAEIKNSKTPDPRTTIYWKGNLTTNSKGEASVNFYTADNATNYSVTISGITAMGDLVYKRIIISRN